MPFVVAAPAAVIGATGALWSLITILFDLGTPPGRFTSGIVFGLGTYLLLAASHNAPYERIRAPRLRRSILLGLICFTAFWLISVAANGPLGALIIALPGALSCAAADRRTVANRRAHGLYRAALVLLLLVTLERVTTALFLDDDPYVGLGTLCAVLVAVFLPIEALRRWALRLVPARRSGAEKPIDLDGYRPEVLALAAFLAPHDIPRALVLAAAHRAGAGRAGSLRALASSALSEAGQDSLHVDPIAQRFARQRMLGKERREWAGRAVRMLADSFPGDYRDPATWPQYERLMPHALAAVEHAEELDVQRGASALLLNEVAGYLAECGRHDEGRAVAERAVSHAAAGFGDTSAELATINANLAHIGDESHVDDSAREGLAVRFALLGDKHRESGDVTSARRDYRTALAHARFELGRDHPLIPDLRARLAALPLPKADESNDRRLVIGCFSLVVALVVICGGIVVLRDRGSGEMRPSDEALDKTRQLGQLCADNPRFFPDAAPFALPATHPVQIFLRTDNDKVFWHQPYGGTVPPRATQIVGCAEQTNTGPRVKPCEYRDLPQIPLHQATYLVTFYETRTGTRLGAQMITATDGRCPVTYRPPAEDMPWMLYATPSDDQYQRALVPIEDSLTLEQAIRP